MFLFISWTAHVTPCGKHSFTFSVHTRKQSIIADTARTRQERSARTPTSFPICWFSVFVLYISIMYRYATEAHRFQQWWVRSTPRQKKRTWHCSWKELLCLKIHVWEQEMKAEGALRSSEGSQSDSSSHEGRYLFIYFPRFFFSVSKVSRASEQRRKNKWPRINAGRGKVVEVWPRLVRATTSVSFGKWRRRNMTFPFLFCF